METQGGITHSKARPRRIPEKDQQWNRCGKTMKLGGWGEPQVKVTYTDYNLPLQNSKDETSAGRDGEEKRECPCEQKPIEGHKKEPNRASFWS